MHLFSIPQCSIQKRNVHISVLGWALWIWNRCILGFVKLLKYKFNSTSIHNLMKRNALEYIPQLQLPLVGREEFQESRTQRRNKAFWWDLNTREEYVIRYLNVSGMSSGGHFWNHYLDSLSLMRVTVKHWTPGIHTFNLRVPDRQMSGEDFTI